MAAIPPPPGRTAAAAPAPAPPNSKPLQKPPGYRDPSAPPNSKPLQKPPGYREPSAPPPSGPPPRRNPAAAPAPARLNRPLPPPSYRGAMNGNGAAHNAKQQQYCRGRNSRAPPPRRGARCCCTSRRCCCCTLALLLLFLLALALAGGLAYLLLQPRAPAFHLQTLRVPLLRVSVRPDGTFLDANASAAVLAANPNGKLDLLYKDGRIRISAEDDDGDVDIGAPEAFQGFAQAAGNSTVLRAAARVKGAVVGDAVGSRLRARFQSGELRFVVELRTRVAVKVKGGKRVTVPVKVRCGGLTLKQVGGAGARADAANKCSINLLRWINL